MLALSMFATVPSGAAMAKPTTLTKHLDKTVTFVIVNNFGMNTYSQVKLQSCASIDKTKKTVKVKKNGKIVSQKRVEYTHPYFWGEVESITGSKPTVTVTNPYIYNSSTKKSTSISLSSTDGLWGGRPFMCWAKDNKKVKYTYTQSDSANYSLRYSIVFGCSGAFVPTKAYALNNGNGISLKY